MASYKYTSRGNSCVSKHLGSSVLHMNVNISFSCCHRRSSEVLRVQEPEPAPEPAPAEAEPAPAEAVRPTDTSSSEAEAEEVEFRGPNEDEIGQDFRIGSQSGRFYCVWKFSSGSPDWKGIHWGFERAAYDGIRRLNGGHFGGLRWKRADSYLGAVALYNSKRTEFEEAEGDPINYYLWK